MAGSVCGLEVEYDGVAECVEAADQALVGAILIDAVEMIGTEVGEGDGALEHVEAALRISCAVGMAAFFLPMRARSRWNLLRG